MHWCLLDVDQHWSVFTFNVRCCDYVCLSAVGGDALATAPELR